MPAVRADQTRDGCKRGAATAHDVDTVTMRERRIG
eukprot:CAMPEP_0194384150 /NCGR_PEP_ID=MMETSP0174-20130528/72254_1 /TAXON_ID=216777 /ORGANISM="Proboscia alata, Strain PI-D3" /LENGTH=34 /DNA_ID= /DNA_START= /DNA_END= /DNA_ORIENTATION=